MAREINIRRFTKEGSTTTPHVLEEAETILKEHQRKGGLAIDEDSRELIHELTPEVTNVLLLDPIIGG